MTELELIRAAQAGDRRAAGELYKMHKGFLHVMVRKYRVPGFDYEDMLQLAGIGLLEAIKGYDQSKECKLLTLAFHRIRRQFHYELMLNKAKKRTAIILSFEQQVQETELTLKDVIAAPEEPTGADYIPRLAKCISTIKNTKKRAIFEAIAEQLAIGEIVTLAEVGEMFNLSRERVRQIKEREIKGPAFQRLRGELLQG